MNAFRFSISSNVLKPACRCLWSGLLLIGSFLSGCAVDRYQNALNPQEQADLSRKKSGEPTQLLGGVAIYAHGVPSGPYEVLGVLHDKRRVAGYSETNFIEEIARVTREHGGNTAVILGRESRTEADLRVDCAAALSTSNICNGGQGASSSTGAPDGEASIYSQNRNSVNEPLEYRDSAVVVIRTTRSP
jgi:hypothetical protein